MNNRRLLYTLLLAIVATFSVQINAQEKVKRYVTVELYTNTPCPICVAQNPGFFDLMADYPENVHLISFYPGQPYSQCPLYQSNTGQNAFRTTYRNISSTPTVWVNGDITKSSGSINAADIDRYTSDSSFLGISVEETGVVMVTATVELKTYGMPTTPAGKLFVAIVERDVTLTGIPSSWERDHFDVFREFVTPQEGLIVNLADGDQTISVDYLRNPDWDIAKTYLLAWVEHPETREVYNSGTRFDPLVGSIDIDRHLSMEIYPNPASDELHIDLPDNFKLDRIEFLDYSGKAILTSQNPTTIDVSQLPAGSYVVMAWSKDSGHIVSRVALSGK